jgi:hypothetical protein
LEGSTGIKRKLAGMIVASAVCGAECFDAAGTESAALPALEAEEAPIATAA